MNRKRLRDQVNVKMPLPYVEIIDKNLERNKLLWKAGYVSRAHFVRETIKEKLMQFGLLTEEAQKRFETGEEFFSARA